jgi:hypothetical protein
VAVRSNSHSHFGFISSDYMQSIFITIVFFVVRTCFLSTDSDYVKFVRYILNISHRRHCNNFLLITRALNRTEQHNFAEYEPEPNLYN